MGVYVGAERVVLVVDDDRRVHRAAKASLGARWLVHSAEDLEQARSAITKRAPHLVIADLWLGAESGLELLRELRQSHPHLPTALISGRLSHQLAIEASGARIAVIAEKPISFRTIVATLAALEPEALTEPSRWIGSDRIGSDRIGSDRIGSGAGSPRAVLEDAKRELEASLIEQSLNNNGWNISATARELGIPRSVLYTHLDKHGLRDDDD